MSAQIDKFGFTATILVVLLISVPLFFAPEAGAKIMTDLYSFIAVNFGFLYLLAGSGTLILLIWLAFGKYGKIKLGDADDTPDFSTFSWIGMLFCAGVGAGLLYWSSIEWVSYYQSPPFGVEAESTEAANWASSYGIFHWGLTAWAFYCLPTLAIAYPFYVKKIPFLKFSTSCHYIFKGENNFGSRCIDFLFRVALIGGAGSSLGFSTPLIAACIANLTGIEQSFALETAVVLFCVLIFAVSVYAGLEKGIKRLSDFNLILAILLLAFVLIAGPTLFLFKSGLNSIGMVAQNFIQMNTWTDPFTESNFVEDWTVFYWAWWIAYGPFVGIFVTRISRGRTIRQVIVGMLTWGSLGGALFYMIFGNFSLFQQLSGNVDVINIMQHQSGNIAILAGFEQLPFGSLVIALFCLMSIIFSATTYDSAAYTLAASATRELHPNEDPPRWHRAFWAFALALLPITLMYVGGLKVAQTAVLVVSLPIVFVFALMTYSLIKTLQQDHVQQASQINRD